MKMPNKIKKKCDKCGRMIREVTFHEGKFLCGRCRRYGQSGGKRNKNGKR